MVDPATIAEPAAFFVISGTLLLLDWNVDDLITPVKHGGNTLEELDALERRLVQWSLIPMISQKVKAGGKDVLQFEDVGPTYNDSLEQINSARENLTRFDEQVIDLRRAVKLAAISLLPAGAYGSIVVGYPQYDAWFLAIAFLSFVAFWGFASIGLYAYLILRRARTTCRNQMAAVTTRLNTLQTILISGGKV